MMGYLRRSLVRAGEGLEDSAPIEWLHWAEVVHQWDVLVGPGCVVTHCAEGIQLSLRDSDRLVEDGPGHALETSRRGQGSLVTKELVKA